MYPAMDEIRLTSFSQFGGCGAKLSAEHLNAILDSLSRSKKDEILKLEEMDDAAIYKISDDLTLVFSVDFFTPIVDDPYVFGQIAAANSLNDIYAMGGTPLMALNIVEFPMDDIDVHVLNRILEGGRDKAAEAGAMVVGGHTLKGMGVKYGLVVLGKVGKGNLRKRSDAKVGDKLVLTKPLGVGIIATAIKMGIADKGSVDAACKIMSELNDKSSSIMNAVGANACTDITGFGLMGHAIGMAKGSKVGIRLFADSIPYIKEALELANKGITPSAMCTNRNYFSKDVIPSGKVQKNILEIMYDPQTAGGLLISAPPKKAKRMISEMRKQGIEATIIGEVINTHIGKILLD